MIELKTLEELLRNDLARGNNCEYFIRIKEGRIIKIKNINTIREENAD